MTFTRPDAWLLVLLAIPLVLLHLRWKRRRDAEVPSLALWRDVAVAGSGRRGLRRVEDAAQLAALVASLVFLTAALAGPVIGQSADAVRRRVIVLDDSASMNARCGDSTRFDEARAAALDAIAKLGPGDEVVVWTASARPRVVVEPTTDLASARAVVAALRPTLERSGVSGTLDLVRVALRDAGPWDAVVLTDAVGAASIRGAGHAGVTIGIVGGAAASNLAIADARIDVERQIRLRVERTDGAARRCTLRLTRTPSAEPPVEVELVLGDDGTAERSLAVGDVPAGGAVVEVRLVSTAGVADDFAEDDAVSFVLAPPLRHRVALVAPVENGLPVPSPFLVAALRAMPDVVDADHGIVAAPAAPAAAFAECDVVIGDGVLAAAAPRDRPWIAWGVRGGRMVSHPVIWGVGRHPVTEGADLAPLRIDRASVLDLEPGERAILECAEGVVAAAGEADGVRRVRFGFAPGATTLPLEPAFPVLVRNAIRWVTRPVLLPPSVVAGGALVTAEPLPPVERLWFAGPGDLPPRPALVQGGAFFETVPPPAPGGGRILTVRGLPGDPRTAVHWFPPPAFHLVPAAYDFPAAQDAVRDLADRSGNRDERVPLAGWCAASAAALLAVSLVFLRRVPAPA